MLKLILLRSFQWGTYFYGYMHSVMISDITDAFHLNNCQDTAE